MFLGLRWDWWVVIAVVLAVAIPFKVKFMKWWGSRRQDKECTRQNKWGDEE